MPRQPCDRAPARSPMSARRQQFEPHQDQMADNRRGRASGWQPSRGQAGLDISRMSCLILSLREGMPALRPEEKAPVLRHRPQSSKAACSRSNRADYALYVPSFGRLRNMLPRKSDGRASNDFSHQEEGPSFLLDK